MTDAFKDRERGFENKFAHDEELRFKALARRNKLVGLWAAGLLGKQGQAAQSYAMDVLHADFEVGRDQVAHKLAVDLGGCADEPAIRAKMAEMLALAQDQIMTELDAQA